MKHLILDAGGVLVYPRLGEWHIPFGAAAILGRPRADTLGSPEFRRAQAAAMAWLDESRVVATVDEERALRERFVRDVDAAMGWRMTESEIAAMTDDFTDNPQRYGFFDDVDACLTRLKHGHRLAILSDAMPSLLPVLEGRGILRLFDAVVISTQVGALKPDRRMFEAVLDRLDADPGDCLFVDDRAANVRGAVAAGMRAVQMARPGFPADAPWGGPRVRGLAELDDIIEEDLPE